MAGGGPWWGCFQGGKDAGMWWEPRLGPFLVPGWRTAPQDLLSVPVTSSSRPCPGSIYNSASTVRLSLASPQAEKEQPPGLGERSVYK